MASHCRGINILSGRIYPGDILWMRQNWGVRFIRYTYECSDPYVFESETSANMLFSAVTTEVDAMLPRCAIPATPPTATAKLMISLAVKLSNGEQVLGGGYHLMFGSPISRENFLKFWKRMARRYAGNTDIWGFDILGEPFPPTTTSGDIDAIQNYSNWNEQSVGIVQAIASQDPNRRVVIQAIAGSVSWANRLISLDALVKKRLPTLTNHVHYGIHFYEPKSILLTTADKAAVAPNPRHAYPDATKGRDLAWLRATYFQELVRLQAVASYPIIVSEFGIARWAPPSIPPGPHKSAFNWMRDVIKICEQYGFHWYYYYACSPNPIPPGGSFYSLIHDNNFPAAQYAMGPCPVDRPGCNFLTPTLTSDRLTMLKACWAAPPSAPLPPGWDA